LPAGNHYGFLASAKGFISVSDHLDVSDLKEYSELKRDLFLVPAVAGETVRLNNIFFDFGKSDLKDESAPELNRLIKLMNENPELIIALSGHTDHVGSDEDNLRLSQNRINAVMNYLLKNGIKPDRMSATGYGESRPVASNETDEGRALNRRVEFTIVK
jgi:outer membrane protein OmpA-like peptidoglycan-associated protein